MNPSADPSDNLLRTRALAAAMYPTEQWVEDAQTGVYVAASRHNRDLQKELDQAAILTKNGSVVFLLPEAPRDRRKKADAVIDGKIVELKASSGNRNTIGAEFKQAYRQGRTTLEKYPHLVAEHSVFLDLQTEEPVESIMAKLAGELKERDHDGSVICYFRNTADLYFWPYAELRKLIKSKKITKST
jgi:hypothetical protein